MSEAKAAEVKHNAAKKVLEKELAERIGSPGSRAVLSKRVQNQDE